MIARVFQGQWRFRVNCSGRSSEDHNGSGAASGGAATAGSGPTAGSPATGASGGALGEYMRDGPGPNCLAPGALYFCPRSTSSPPGCTCDYNPNAMHQATCI